MLFVKAWDTGVLSSTPVTVFPDECVTYSDPVDEDSHACSLKQVSPSPALDKGFLFDNIQPSSDPEQGQSLSLESDSKDIVTTDV